MSLVTARGATFVPAPPTAGDPSDGYVLSALRWDATVYSYLAGALAAAIGVESAVGRSVEPLADLGKGFVAKMERKGVQLFEALPRADGAGRALR